MNQLRETLQMMNEHLVALNKAYEKQDHDANEQEYNNFKDCVAVVQTLGCKVVVHETWENEFVTCEVEVKGVKW